MEEVNAMTGKRRTPIPRSQARKRKPRSKPAQRPKGEAERLAVRRLAVMKYRLAGASYLAIAEKLTVRGPANMRMRTGSALNGP